MKRKKHTPRGLQSRPLILALSLLALLAAPGGARAQGGIEILEHRADYRFNEWLHLQARFDSVDTLVDGRVFVQAEGANQTQVIEAAPNAQDEIDLEITLGGDFAPAAFSTLEYWFVVTARGGELFESPHYQLAYDDNRYTWQSLNRGAFTVTWHNGGQDLGEAILSAAEQGVERTQTLLPLPAPQHLDLRVYDSAQDVQTVLQLAGYSWVAGHTDPKLGVILLSLTPGSLEIERQVPHEVAHAMLYQAAQENGYAQLPVWLVEGIASNAEVLSDPQWGDLLANADADGRLLPLASLCAAFPQDAGAARLAYAEASAFVAYLRQRYGVVGLGALVDAYAANGDCLNASQAVLGQDLVGLEAEWRVAYFNPQSDVERFLAQTPWTGLGLAALLFGAVAWFLRRRRQRVQ